MHKIKMWTLSFAYLILVLLSAPLVLAILLCALVVYGTIRVERLLIDGIDDVEVTEAWNLMLNAYYDAQESASETFLTEMEL